MSPNSIVVPTVLREIEFENIYQALYALGFGLVFGNVARMENSSYSKQLSRESSQQQCIFSGKREK